MSSRRRRSNDFTSSVKEYQRQMQEEKDPDANNTCALNLKNLAPEKKNMVRVQSNETISPDTTIFNQVSTLRSQLNSQKQNLAHDSKSHKTPIKSERAISTETPLSPITNVLHKINKALEVKRDKEESKPKMEPCRQEPSKLWNALSKYNRSLNSDKNGVQSHQKVLSRLSQEFHSSPTKFAEKLVTIIEDSVMPSISEHKDCSGVSVHRMTQEFRKLCKFIEDESMPEWIMSPDTILEEQIENQSIELVDESSLDEFETFASTPVGKNCTNAYKETPKSIFRFQDSPSNSDKKLVNKVIKNCRFNDTNNSFEYWESMCNGVFLQQRVTPQGLRRSLSLLDSPVTRMNNIRTTCERQMASLDDNAINENQTISRRRFFHDFTEESSFNPNKLKVEAAKTSTSKKYFSEQSGETRKAERTKKISPKKRALIRKQPANITRYSPNCEDDLDKSLLVELAQRRQRCFETAKLMMEIDKNDPIVSGGKDTTELLSKLGSPNKSLSLPDNNVEFLSTINHCMEYQDFLLKKRKTIFNIIQHPKTSDTDSGIAVESNLKPESPLPPVKSKTPVGKIIKSEEKKDKKSPRRRFFFTPGKSPKQEEVKKKKEYFPQMENIINVQSTVNLAKSPRNPEVRKNIYEYVKSPIAEYIKGTDPKLMKNIQAKNNDWLLTPQPLGIASESNENRITPLKNIQEGSVLRFNLSPMGKKIADYPAQEGENVNEKEFKLPKIVYKSPAKIHTISENSENEQKNPGLRMKTLLKSAEKKIVIRHEGRVAAPSPRNKDKDEIDDKMVDTSIHVKTIAKKTDSIRTRNVR